MQLLKSFWRWLNPEPKEYTEEELKRRIRRECEGLGSRVPSWALETVAYDPSEDPEKILKGENESYFDN